MSVTANSTWKKTDVTHLSVAWTCYNIQHVRSCYVPLLSQQKLSWRFLTNRPADGGWDRRERDLLRYGGEDAEPGTELLDGSSGFKPAVSLLLLGLEELITEVLPLLRCERAQNPVIMENWRVKLLDMCVNLAGGEGLM